MVYAVMDVAMNVADKKARQGGFRGRLCLRKAERSSPPRCFTL